MPVPAPDYELGQFFDLSPDLLCIAGFDGYFKRVNPSFERVLGYSGEELTSRPFLEFVHPDDVERARDAFIDLATAEDLFGFECRLVCVDGSVRRFEWNTRTLAHEGVLYGVARDVTVRSALAEEQAALRRMATMVAEAAPPAEIFSAVSNEVAAIFHTELVVVGKFDGDPAELLVVGVGDGADEPVVGSRWKLDDALASAAVYRTGLPARVDHPGGSGDLDVAAILDRIRPVATVAVPIQVEGRLWGAMIISTLSEPLPADTDERLQSFTDLIATALANAESREALAELADEQAALRRVATMVAQGLPASELFGAVAREVGALLGTDFAGIGRFEADAVIAVASSNETMLPTGTRWEIDDVSASAQVYRTGKSVRVDGMDWSRVRGSLSAASARLGVVSTVASPIIVDGRTWGAVSVSSTHEALPPDTEARLASFTELVATAIANAESSAELAASRARITAAADDERRRVVRDLHDGAQQRQVHTVITLKLAQRALAKGAENGPLLLQEAIGHAEQANVELRELAHGILPAVLTRGGLRAGVRALASRSPVPVEIGISVGRLPAAVESTAYFVVAEALTNVAKHSSAGHAEVVARIEDGILRVEVRDDGVGGASPDGTGLVGLADRLAVLDGRLEVDSPPGGGTRLTAAIALPRSGRSASA
jgi:PAS domain S-box-containing protein